MVSCQRKNMSDTEYDFRRKIIHLARTQNVLKFAFLSKYTFLFYTRDPRGIRTRSVSDPRRIWDVNPKTFQKRGRPLTSQREPYAVALGNLILHEPESVGRADGARTDGRRTADGGGRRTAAGLAPLASARSVGGRTDGFSGSKMSGNNYHF